MNLQNQKKAMKAPRTPAEPNDLQKIWDGKLKPLHKRWWRRTLLRNIVLILAGMYLLLGVFFGIRVVYGNSMFPNVKDGDIVVFTRMGSVYQRGEVVLLKAAERSDCIKRILAVPGQTVDINSQGEIWIDGILIEESYITGETQKKSAVDFPLILREDEYFVLGDHRKNSNDSRNYGPVKEADIYGTVCWIIRTSASHI